MFQALPHKWPDIDLDILIGGLFLCLLRHSIQPYLPSFCLDAQRCWTQDSDFTVVWDAAMTHVDSLLTYVMKEVKRDTMFFLYFRKSWKTYFTGISCARDRLEQRRFDRIVANAWAPQHSTTEPPVVVIDTIAFEDNLPLSGGVFLFEYVDPILDTLSQLPIRPSMSARFFPEIGWGPSDVHTDRCVFHFQPGFLLFTAL